MVNRNHTTGNYLAMNAAEQGEKFREACDIFKSQPTGILIPDALIAAGIVVGPYDLIHCIADIADYESRAELFVQYGAYIGPITAQEDAKAQFLKAF